MNEQHIPLTEDVYFQICDNISACVMSVYENEDCSNGVAVTITPMMWEDEGSKTWAIDTTIEEQGIYGYLRTYDMIFINNKWNAVKAQINGMRKAIEERRANG